MIVTFLEEGVGGVETLVMRTAKKLVALGEKLSIVTCYFIDSAERREKFCFKKFVEGITIYRIPALHGFTTLNACLFFIGCFIVFLSTFKKTTILHAFQVNSSGVIACLLKKTLKLRVIVQDICGGSVGDIATLKQMPFSKYLIGLAKKADIYISPSTQITQELMDVGFLPAKIKAVAHGVDIDIFSPLNDKEQDLLNRKRLSLHGTRNVTFVGRLVPQKRPLFLLETWELVIKEHTQLRLLIFGEGELEDELKKFCKEKGLETSVNFMGVIKKLLPYYRATDVFVLPSCDEGVSIALLEAMSCGLAIVASNVPGNTEVIHERKSGLLFEKEDRVECAQKIAALLKDEELANRLKNGARKAVVEKYSSDVMAKALIEVYRKLLPKKVVGKKKTL